MSGFIFWELDLYLWYLNLYFSQIELYLLSELILLGKRDLGPIGTRAQIGPGPKWDPGPNWAGPKWDPGPNRTRAQMGPGPKPGRAQMGPRPKPGPNGTLTKNLSVVAFSERIGPGNKIDMAI